MGRYFCPRTQREMWICDVDVAKSDALRIRRSPSVSCDLRVLVETHWGLLSVQEHGRDMWIYDVEVVKSDALKIQRNLRVSGDQEGLFETSWCPLWALLGPSWGTVGAYPFDMLKNEESSATAGKQGPAVGGSASGETLSKQVYLGRD